MYVPLRQSVTSHGQAFRIVGRFAAVILFGSWLVLLMGELARGNVSQPTGDMLLQAAAFAVVFAGYTIGLRHELAGGLLAIIGTIAFLVVTTFTFGFSTSLSFVNAAWFAAPGILYLLAWQYDKTHGNHLGSLR